MKTLWTLLLALLCTCSYAQTLTVTPNTVSKGQHLSILFSGTGLHFQQGSSTTSVRFVQGTSTIWYNNIHAIDSNHLVGDYTISANYTLCGSYSAVIFGQGSTTMTFPNALNVDCSTTISGHVYNDQDSSGTDNGEPGLSHVAVRVQPGNITGYTDVNGDYTMPVAAGSYQVTVSPYGYYAQSSAPVSYTANTSVTPTISGIDFGMHAPPVNDMTVYINGPHPRSGFSRTFWISLGNYGTTTQTPTVVLTLDSLMTIATCAYPYTTSGHTYTITPGISVDPDTYEGFGLDLMADATAPLNQTTQIAVALTNTLTPDMNPLNNSFTLNSYFVNSFDPNEKDVTPAGVGPQHETLRSTEALQYLVRFQNTGNDVAYLVRVADTLDTNLDLSTFRILGSSHPVDFTMQPGGAVMFTFSNINLPAKSVDEPGSNGYVSYSIKAKTNIAEGTVISNTASIYFDFNPAIVTNTTTSKMVTTYTGILDQSIAGQFSIYPNPSATVLHITNQTAQISEVTVYDMLGAVVLDQRAEGMSVHISTASIASGVYVLKVRTDKGDLMQRLSVVH